VSGLHITLNYHNLLNCFLKPEMTLPVKPVHSNAQSRDREWTWITTLERRTAILKHLCRNRFDTSANLSVMFNVSERTIRSDVVFLSCSYPIQTIRGHGGGIQLADGFYVDRNALNAKQYALLKKLLLRLQGEDYVVMVSIISQFAPYRGC